MPARANPGGQELSLVGNRSEGQDYASKSKSMLYLTLNTSSATSGTAQINFEMLVQTLILKSVRIHYVNSSASTQYPTLYLKMSSFTYGNIASNVPFVAIPILSQTDSLDSTWNPDIAISLAKKLPREIKWSLCDITGKEIQNGHVSFVQIVFELEE